MPTSHWGSMDNQQDTSSPSRPPEQRGGFKVATRPSSPKPKRVFYSPKQSRKPSIPNDPANNQPNNLVSPSPFRRTKNFASFDYVRKEVKSLPISPSTSRSVPEHPVDSHFTLDQKQKAHSLDQETTSSPSLSNATDRATTIFSASLSPSDNRKTGVLWGATPEVHASEDNIGHVKRDNSPVNRRDSVRKSKGPSLKKVSGTSSQSPDSISAVKELDKKLGDGLPVEDGPRGSKFVLEGKGDKGENGGTMGGHSFAITTLKKPTWCHVCREFIWGILYQVCGYFVLIVPLFVANILPFKYRPTNVLFAMPSVTTVAFPPPHLFHVFLLPSSLPLLLPFPQK